MLLGWVDETGQGATSWLRLWPVGEELGVFRSAGVEEVFCGESTHLRITARSLEILAP